MDKHEEQALDHYWKSEYAEALPLFIQAAEAGHADAMMMLAHLHDDGLGVAPDWERSYEWAQRAIAAGSVTAWMNLGVSHRRRGEIRAARDCFQAAMERGDGDAALELANLYLVSDLEIPRVVKLLQVVLDSANVTLESREQAQALLLELQDGPGSSHNP